MFRCGVVTGVITLVTFARGLGGDAATSSVRLAGNCAGDSLHYAFTVRQATAMSVAATASGTDVVTSILGDLYRIPLSGGQAIRLSSGPAWDTDPGSSPDGKRIVFASDRDGGSNLWIVEADGSGVRQLTHERDRVLEEPAWSADGRFVVASQHSTRGDRTLPPLVVFNASSGLVVRQVGDPATVMANPSFGAHADTLYVTADGDRIARVNVSAGTVTYITSPERGCGLRPTPFDGGRRLLWLCATGAKVMVYSGDAFARRQVQVAAIDSHDANPASEGRQLVSRGVFVHSDSEYVMAARGRLWRLNLSDGRIVEVPFSATIAGAMRCTRPFRTQIDGRAVVSRAATAVNEQPGGRHLAFVAFGKIYVQGTTDSTGRRISNSGGGTVELTPRWWSDGVTLVYSEWTPGAGTSIVALNSSTGSRRTLHTDSALLMNASLDQEGRWLMATRLLPSRRTDHVGQKPGREAQIVGIPLVPARREVVVATVEANWVGDVAPPVAVFAAHDSVIVVTSTFHDVVEVRLVERQTLRLLRHIRAVGARDVTVSADLTLMALSNRAETVLVPFPPNDTTVTIAAGNPSTVGRIVFAPGAWHTQWTGGGKLLGCIGANCSVADIGADTCCRRLELRASAPVFRGAGVVVLRHATVLPMANGRIADGTVIVRDGVIEAVGSTPQLLVPRDAVVVDLRGRFVVPGFVDAHSHVKAARQQVADEVNRTLLASLRVGVTTVFDPQADDEAIFSLAESVEAGQAVGPRLLSSGTPFYGGLGYDVANQAAFVDIRNEHDAELATDAQAVLGAAVIKVYAQPKRSIRQWLRAGTTARRIGVTAEGACDLNLLGTIVIDGYDAIEHGVPQALYEDYTTLVARSGVYLTPTLVTGCISDRAEDWFGAHVGPAEFAQMRRIAGTGASLDLGRPAGLDTARWPLMAQFAGRVAEAGGHIAVGSHGDIPGIGFLWEMRALSVGGMSPSDVLRAATLGGAAKLGLDWYLGSITAGKAADLVVLKRDPERATPTATDIMFVVRAGVVYRVPNLIRIAP